MIHSPNKPFVESLKHVRYPDGGTLLRAVGDPIDMLVDNFYREMVGYIVELRCDQESNRTDAVPMGTVFFLTVPHGQGHYAYMVTCRHLIEPDRVGVYPPLFVRVNLIDGTFKDIPISRDEWIKSETSDIAIAPMRLDPKVYRYFCYPILEVQGWSFRQPVPGDQIFMTGLFVSKPGENSVQALVRSGTVARENVREDIEVDLSTSKRLNATVHLIEARSWGGESGSPVFSYRQKTEMRHPFPVPPPYIMDQPTIQTHYEPQMMGMLQGHYHVPGHNYENETANSGIAIVVPVQQILGMLKDDPRFVSDREEREERAAQKRKGPIAI